MKKTYIQTNDAFNADMEILKELNPGFSGAMLIRLAVKQAALNNFTISMAGADDTTSSGSARRKKAQPKDAWCEAFGGSMRDGLCTIDRYETVGTGHVRKDKRVIALTAFPIERDDFRKDVMGHFETVEEAREAYEAKPLK